MRLVKIGLVPMIFGATMLSAENVDKYFDEGFTADDIPQVRHVKRHKKHKVVVHVDSTDPKVQNLALNNVLNMRKAFGDKRVKIEVVANGPGIVMLLAESEVYDRILEMAQIKGIRFSACNNSLNAYRRKHGTEPELIDHVKVVPSGAARIIELEERHFGYFRP